MPTLLSIKAQALALSERDRAALAEELLLSLPPDQAYEEEGLVEAQRRDAEMRADPSCAISFAELKRRIASR